MFLFYISCVRVGVGKFKELIGSTSYITLCLLKNFIYNFLKGNIIEQMKLWLLFLCEP